MRRKTMCCGGLCGQILRREALWREALRVKTLI